MNFRINKLSILFLLTFAILSFSRETKAQEFKILTSIPQKLNYFLFQLSGKINSENKVSEVGFCISNHTLPTINDTKIICSNTPESSFKAIAGTNHLKKGSSYFIRSYGRLDGNIIYGNEVTISTYDQKFNIGDFYQGGIIIYIFEPTDKLYVKGEVHGIVAAKEDLKEQFSWDGIIRLNNGTYRIVPSKSTGDEVGSGRSNTVTVLKEVQQKIQSFNITNKAELLKQPAAKICGELVMNGYNDWFLPSLSEMNIMWFYQTQNMKLSDKSLYWTSTSYNFNTAVAIGFKEKPIIN